jgi:hypothetical protein
MIRNYQKRIGIATALSLTLGTGRLWQLRGQRLLVSR